MNYVLLRAQLERHEGIRARPYKCSAGKLTIGIGHNLDDTDLPATIIKDLFEIDIAEAIRSCAILFRTWHLVPPMKQTVLANMAFQLGRHRLGRFRRLIKAVNNSDWGKAALEMLDSKWAKKDTPRRANELAEIMRRSEV